jgi:hypothetical protein
MADGWQSAVGSWGYIHSLSSAEWQGNLLSHTIVALAMLSEPSVGPTEGFYCAAVDLGRWPVNKTRFPLVTSVTETRIIIDIADVLAGKRNASAIAMAHADWP